MQQRLSLSPSFAIKQQLQAVRVFGISLRSSEPGVSISRQQPMLTFCKYAAFAALAMLCEQARSENTVHFESLSPEFDRLVGPTP